MNLYHRKLFKAINTAESPAALAKVIAQWIDSGRFQSENRMDVVTILEKALLRCSQPVGFGKMRRTAKFAVYTYAFL